MGRVKQLWQEQQEELFDKLVAAFREGAEAVHKFHHPEDEGSPDFTEAAHDYARSVMEAEENRFGGDPS